MSALDRWRAFSDGPQTLTLPKMVLRAGDWDPLVLVGSGVVQAPELQRFTFELEGLPEDVGATFRALRRMQTDVYDGRARLRLEGVDTEGVEWAFGWCQPRVTPLADGAWRAEGHLDVISPQVDSGPDNALGTELAYVIGHDNPVSLVLGRATAALLGQPHRRGRTIEVLGATLTFTYATDTRFLFVHASPSDALPLTYAENWLSEPLKILFGQPISPRLVARNTGQGRGHIFIARVAGELKSSVWSGLWDWETDDIDGFWPLFDQLLTFLVLDRGADPDLDAHRLTRFYDEIRQAAIGSTWVWAMTYASTIEGLLKMIAPEVEPADETEIEAFTRHVQAWEGDESFVPLAVAAVRNAKRDSAMDRLRALEAEGRVTKTQRKAWAAVRNRVMHGTLLSPYSLKVEDDQLMALATLTHTLTRLLVGRRPPIAACKEANSTSAEG